MSVGAVLINSKIDAKNIGLCGADDTLPGDQVGDGFDFGIEQQVEIGVIPQKV
jgi:hypothetical protein